MKELFTIQTELKAPKGQYNSFGKYKYRSCEDILEAVKPLLAKTKCTLTLSDEVKAEGGRFYIQATATLTNGANESVSACGWAREEEAKKGMDASQVTGAASSYARKYALNGLFAIDDTKDSDATNNGKEAVKSPTSFDEILNGNDPLYTPIAKAVENATTADDLRQIYSDNLGLFRVQSDAIAAVIREKLIEKGKRYETK